ncbi:unnamed protein product [Darwinula stevensoni]|uniref:CARD domain-containing protein n=1 Tax=Darwinula stevensoni TaxID=69355 RepID=A0A7R9A770_9CRUS|nr:unnamed protein product [Darwinula stevensoni]CAG0891888.1 unnamed protein product [Darwinula stevensoni]
MGSGKPIADVMLKYQREFEFIKHDDILRDLRIGGFLENQEFWQNVKKDVNGKVSFLVENLPGKGDRAFQAFLASLEQHDHGTLAGALRVDSGLSLSHQEPRSAPVASIMQNEPERGNSTREEVDYTATLRRLKTIFKDKNTLIDMDDFLDKLAEKGLISMAEELEFKKKSEEVDYTAALRRLKTIFKDKNTLIDMDDFLDKLAEKGLISMAEELEFKKKSYAERIDSAFFALLKKNPKLAYECVLKIIGEMERDDIKAKFLNSLGKPSSQNV